MGNPAFAGKVAIVTGATGGIGRGVALRLAADGAAVVVNGRDPHKGAAVVAAIEQTGGRAAFVAGDVLSRQDMDALATRAERLFGGIDIVIANAGGRDEVGRSPQVRGRFGEIDLARASAWVGDAMLAKLLPVQSALPCLRRRGGGSVVLVTSEGGRVPTKGQTASASWAGGLIMSTKVIAKELAQDKIRVNCVCVTLVRETPGWDAMRQQGVMSEAHVRQYEKIEQRAPFGLACPDDIGAVVAFLASGAAGFITGAALSATGGLTVS